FKVTGVEERKGIIQTILENEPNILDNLYILNERSTADYKKYIFSKSVDIQQYIQQYEFLAAVNMQKLDEQGLLYLFEDEIGPRERWELYDYLRLDEDGNIIAIKVQDHNDGGYTIGHGIFISEEYPDRIELAESLGIDWDNTDEWVTIENINIMFSEISPDYDGYTKYVEKNTGVLFTPVQYAAVYDLLYLRPFLKEYFVNLINENADRDVWITTLKDAVRKQAGEDNWEMFGNGWTARIERSVNSYFDGVYYQKE
ncbi:MAG: hypothetical protein K2J95_03985, partial [Lachnospiraceae bacterium]|nr:hypothetical protein [Lachnospiraceae bacterium]